jgi:hypothetical protein
MPLHSPVKFKACAVVGGGVVVGSVVTGDVVAGSVVVGSVVVEGAAGDGVVVVGAVVVVSVGSAVPQLLMSAMEATRSSENKTNILISHLLQITSYPNKKAPATVIFYDY